MEKTKQVGAAICAAFECFGCPYSLSGRCRGCEGENEALIEGQGAACAVFLCARGQGLDTCEDCLRVPCPFVGRPEEVCPIRLRFEPREESELSLGILVRRLEWRGGGPVVSAARLGRLPERSVLRAWRYTVCLERLLKRGRNFVSSFDLAQESGVKPTLIRKDLSYFGEFGSREGYRTRDLISQLRSVLGLDAEKRTAWVGAERLRGDPEVLNHLARCGFRVAAVFDPEPAQVGTSVATFEVQPMRSLPTAARQGRLSIGVIAVPSLVAQACAEVLIAAGVSYMLNLSGTWIAAPSPAVVKNCNVLGELFALSYEFGPGSQQPPGIDSQRL